MFNIFKKTESPSELASNSPASIDLAELLKHIVVQMVDFPDEVEVKEVEGEHNTILELKVKSEDMGKIIGKKGRIIKALRILLRAAAIHQGRNVSVELVG